MIKNSTKIDIKSFTYLLPMPLFCVIPYQNPLEAVASWLVSSSPDRAVRGSSPGRGHCVVFLGKALYSHSASLQPGV